MKSPHYVPLELALVDEGRFLAQANGDLAELQEKLVKFMQKYGDDSKKAKAKLTIEITLTCEDPKNSFFSVKASTKQTVPNRPPSVNVAMLGLTDDDRDCLWVHRSGATEVPPQQGKICTRAGEMIDQATGEVIQSARPAPPGG